VEQQARFAPLSEQILSKLPNATVVIINHYKELFNRRKQCFSFQKLSPKLILANKRPPFLYPLSKQCQPFFEPHVFYTTPMINCVFDCSFCFLKGMVDSANIVIFVNIDDFFDEVRCAASTVGLDTSISLHISYESDLLALERLTGLCRRWLDFAHTIPNLKVEVRTKSGVFLKKAAPLDRFVAAWSLSPDEVIQKYEIGTPKLFARLSAALSAANQGFLIRLCFDPVIPIDNSAGVYGQLFETVFRTIPRRSILDVGIGPIRAEKSLLKKMKKVNPDCDLFWDETAPSSEILAVELTETLSRFIEKEKIALWQSQS
jgi:spore photoproduct lyase